MEGTCNDLVNGYTCTCFTGYQGVLCDTLKNFCDPNPCQNAGECLNDYVNFKSTCNCKPGGFFFCKYKTQKKF